MMKLIAAVTLGAAFFPVYTLAGEAYFGAAAGYSFANFHNADIVYTGKITSLGGRVSGES